ncbi:hypothetical protein [Thermoflavimicrobium dichotomicum]|uniref:AMP-binding enzyme n=1 Tax=Thermoflavimicrobium dichotomicum TaxID=46223 RepID=A0A1I3LZG5_9BACL|nr:hypothetical protein [Thermoflavimicrobium dichotomicum]SFI90077.1 hypothetical protein SAMN05421852_102384 [Thermoflavimicrobium dichotomicum]
MKVTFPLENENTSLVSLLQMRANQQPHKVAYIFLNNGEECEKTTYYELDQKAREIASSLIKVTRRLQS